jgi:hypothetical protein
MFNKIAKREILDQMVGGELADRAYLETVEKIAEEGMAELLTEEDIEKYAEERIEQITGCYLHALLYADDNEKTAELFEGMEEDEVKEYSLNVAYNKGVATGEELGKQAAEAEMADSMKDYMYNVMAEVLGKEAAEAVIDSYEENDAAYEDIVKMAAQEAAYNIVQEIGAEKVASDEGLQSEIDEAAMQIGEKVAKININMGKIKNLFKKIPKAQKNVAAGAAGATTNVAPPNKIDILKDKFMNNTHLRQVAADYLSAAASKAKSPHFQGFAEGVSDYLNPKTPNKNLFTAMLGGHASRMKEHYKPVVDTMKNVNSLPKAPDTAGSVAGKWVDNFLGGTPRHKAKLDALKSQRMKLKGKRPIFNIIGKRTQPDYTDIDASIKELRAPIIKARQQAAIGAGAGVGAFSLGRGTNDRRY